MKFTVPVRDFAVLLAAVDLRQRLRYRALLDHAVFPVRVPEPTRLLRLLRKALHSPIPGGSSRSASPLSI